MTHGILRVQSRYAFQGVVILGPNSIQSIPQWEPCLFQRGVQPPTQLFGAKAMISCCISRSVEDH